MLVYELRNSKRHPFSRYLLLAIWCLVFGISSEVYALDLDKVKVVFLKGDYKSAISEGERLLAGNATAAHSDELYYILGLSYLKDGNYLRASDIFEIILKEFSQTNFKEGSMLALGDTYFLRGDFSNAEEHYKDLLNSNPGTRFKALTYYRLSQVGFKKGETKDGEEYLNKIKQEFPLNPELMLNEDLSLVPDSSADIYYSVQVGSFTNAANARNLTEILIKKGYDAYIEEVGLKDGKAYRVRVGKLKLRSEVTQLENKLSSEGYPTKICP